MPSPMKGRSTSRKDLLRCLERDFLPKLSERGFEPRPLQGRQTAGALRQAFPLPAMQRVREGRREAVEIQFDKSGEPSFVIAFGVIPVEAIEWPWITIPASEALVSDLHESYRLHPSSRQAWFKTKGPLGFGTKSASEVVRHAAELLPQVLNWFDKGELGPNVRRFSAPTPVSRDGSTGAAKPGV